MSDQPEKKKKEFPVSAAIIVAGFLIALSIFITRSPILNTVKNNSAKNPSAELSSFKPTATDHVRGAKNPTITIVEYSDTECPYCKIYHESLIQVLRAYPNDVAWVYRHFPIDALHSKARKEAISTECAAKLGGEKAFWKYLDILMTMTGSNDRLDHALLPQFAKEAGLNETSFMDCLNANASSGELYDKVDMQIQEAIMAGAEGTPYSIIITNKGQIIPISGAKDFDSLKKFIDATLQN